mgnify:FL=1
MSRVAFTFGGRLKFDYIGATVSYYRNGRDVLGMITHVYRDDDETATFRVRFFNGEEAPDVPAGCVEVLDCTWPPADVE